ncbi:ABC-F family ATP-binding cassette domain-containing protein [Pontibacter sp. G13]|uniref:ABC-F family ATP-binding cassette domain-containing protein n=1 Tax=Pontibacter sp. G13 TaxID=3074898 RepID=UPI00288B6DC2|nr:ABC-F family ATP-binding cassette domain-containing protein [Pontibacter sp. G13]WNJ19009.1 ABC-F family ATP-binding cassette domain-containing protein [Pontibacter sp. G13]
MRNASYQFLPNERIGLIGRNGAGKSTLLKVIAGEIIPTEGKIHKSGNLNIAFFNQDLLSYQTDRAIFEVAKDAFLPLLEQKAKIDLLLKKLESGEAPVEDWDELTQLQDHFEAREGNQIDAKVSGILTGLGFTYDQQLQPFHTFSGGWRMRVLLAKLLLQEPDILLMDEPTNHLDLPSIQWLESYLKSFKGTVILVSHDRFFLDRIAQKIVEISLKKMHEYSGNYSFYLKEKEERHEQHKRAYENQQKFIAEQEKFINRFRYKATKARQVQSKIKQLEKIELLQAPEEEHVKLDIRFEMRIRSGKEVLRMKEVSKSYEDLNVIQGTSATVMRGDKIALIGANGTGKSTFLRMMADTETFEGIREEGHQVQSSFFAQHQLESLDLKRTIFQEMSHSISDKTEQEIRTVLGCFMFSGDTIEKRIQVLSGGEKSRVALAKTLMSEANFLMLDEPTNHLDIPSIQILVDALLAYEGTYVVVSHDRHFLNQVANKVWYIEDGQIKEYPGTYAEYEAWKARQAAPIETEKEVATKADEPTTEADQPAGKSMSFQAQKRAKNRLKKLERELPSIENSIEELETALAAKEAEMADPEVASDFGKLQEVQDSYQKLQTQLNEANEQWEEISMEMEELSELLGN